MPQPKVANLADLGMKFRQWITNAKNQRTCIVTDLLKLLTEYGCGMGPEYVEKATIEEIKNRVINNPELPRKTILEMAVVSLSSLISAL